MRVAQRRQRRVWHERAGADVRARDLEPASATALARSAASLHSRIGVHHRSKDIGVQGLLRGALDTRSPEHQRQHFANNASCASTLKGVEETRLHGFPEHAVRAYYTVSSHDKVQTCVGDMVVAVRDLYQELLWLMGWLPR